MFARALIDESGVHPDECSEAMRTIADFAEQFAALNIVYFAASEDDAGAFSVMEALAATVRASW